MQTQVFSLPNPGSNAPLAFTMLPVEGGQFLMGDEHGDLREACRPVHTVEVGSFYLGKHPVTLAEYDLFCAATRHRKPSDYGWGRENRPVVDVDWDDANAYCQWLGTQTGLPFRLPTEAEWEFAARGGLRSCGFKYAGSDRLRDVGWYDYNSKSQTQPVGQKDANELGLHDMSGNVWEWCADYWDEAYYQKCANKGIMQNPTGPETGSARVLRGGHWDGTARRCRVAGRTNNAPDYRLSRIGFRLALPSQSVGLPSAHL